MALTLVELATTCSESRKHLDNLQNDITATKDRIEFYRRKYVEEIAKTYKFAEIFSFLNGDLLNNILHIGDFNKRYELKDERTNETLAALHISFAVDISGIYIFVSDDGDEEEIYLNDPDSQSDGEAIKKIANKMKEMIEEFKKEMVLKINLEL